MGCGVWGETIHNLRVNHTIKKGFGIKRRKIDFAANKKVD
ncbi:hypothetical protein N0824_03702 [Microcystis sp. 0824]|uniref:Uncharacterized protein n=1 Tax=Microcystis aeruginosa NIES-2549 TaxID=1641812 RepID=A0A0F6U656_MICAE|nr:hypothetical protein MYAER_3501 [Microcystis aeruginosa NIES-2549]AOC54240.1 hypothetical protein amyaer_3537 [Microcystis aeruginosa NIES-2481]GBF55816.1 hypothetical protein N0824_03702 [Microcystis sp. 0824]